ncbi:MAG TPA: hypothetical protein PKH10_13020 [bacterium]|nr:hypothetical protein [bacterium]
MKRRHLIPFAILLAAVTCYLWWRFILLIPEADTLRELVTSLKQRDTEGRALIILYPASEFTAFLPAIDPLKEDILVLPRRFETPPEDALLKKYSSFLLVAPSRFPVTPWDTYRWRPERITESGRFTAYRLSPDRHATYTATSGGRGGNPFLRQCPDGQPFTGMDVVRSGAGFSILSIRCGGNDIALKEPRPTGASISLRCPGDRRVTGLAGTADHHLRGIALSCGAPDGSDEVLSVTAGNMKESRSLASCRRKSATGIFGRRGSLTDAIGLICER